MKEWDDEKAVYGFSGNTCSGVCGHYTQVHDYLFYFSSNFDQTIKAFLLTLREALNTLDTLANFICLEYQMNSQPPIENLSKSSIAYM